MSAIAGMIIAFFALVALIALYYYRPKSAGVTIVNKIEPLSDVDAPQLDSLREHQRKNLSKLRQEEDLAATNLRRKDLGKTVTHRAAPPTSAGRDARVTPVERRNDDDMLMNPLHPLNPLNPIYHQDSSPSARDDSCSAPSHSDHGSSSSYDSSSSSSSYDSGSSSSDSSSSSSCD